MDLYGKKALITGAALRVGREIALCLADAGADIIIHCNRSQKKAEELKKQIVAIGSGAWVVKADLSGKKKPAARTAAELFSRVRKAAGDVDILVNNASVFYPLPLEKVSEKDWDEFMEINLKAPFFLAREFGLRMKKRGAGKIINLLDWTAENPYTEYLPYCISKAGLQAATKGLAKILAPEVQVNGISPGPILKAGTTSKAREKKVVARTLLKRYGHPVDIANTVRYLCEATDYVTGAVIPVEGGSLLA